MNDLQVFKSPEFGEIRSVIINDEPMFCLTDVCKALELTQPSKVKDRLSQKGVNTIPTLTAGGMQNLLYISEPNLYKTIFQSRKESAERFSDWVTGEVLPSIRKNGGYIAGQEEKSLAGNKAPLPFVSFWDTVAKILGLSLLLTAYPH